MAKIIKDNGKQIELSELRKLIRDEIFKQYGSVPMFLNSKEVQKIGGSKLRPYVYDKGSISFHILEKFCAILGIGAVTRKNVITRTTIYYLKPSTTNDKSAS